MMIDRQRVVERSDDVMSGTPVFRGTRVPIQTLFEYLDAGQSIGEFREDFPTVTAEQVHAALALAQEAMLADAHPRLM
jgi:uncharacterized protein (DUF433 family)